jgi:hypothetical protein
MYLISLVSNLYSRNNYVAETAEVFRTRAVESEVPVVLCLRNSSCLCSAIQEPAGRVAGSQTCSKCLDYPTRSGSVPINAHLAFNPFGRRDAASFPPMSSINGGGQKNKSSLLQLRPPINGPLRLPDCGIEGKPKMELPSKASRLRRRSQIQ